MAGARYVVEADGGSRGNPGPAGYGAVVRDADTGRILVEAAEYIGRATNNVAEYRGLIAGLRAARDLDPDARVEVRMDSKLVVEQMSGRWQVKHPDMRPLAAEARAVLPAGNVTYEWIPRERNKDADRLANEAMDAGKQGRRWEPAPRAAAPVAEPAPGPAASAPDASAAAPAAASAPRAGWAGPADLGTPTTLVLLRHGETPLTPLKRFSGSTGSDPGLSEKGRWQAERAADSLAARGTVQAVVASPMLRTRQTAEATARRLGLEVRIEEDLRELDFGDWEGLTFAEVMERHPADLTTWLGSPRPRPPAAPSRSPRWPTGSPGPATGSPPGTPGRPCWWSRTSARSRPWSGWPWAPRRTPCTGWNCPRPRSAPSSTTATATPRCGCSTTPPTCADRVR